MGQRSAHQYSGPGGGDREIRSQRWVTQERKCPDPVCKLQGVN